VNTERAAYWLSVGALPSDQVKSLFKKAGVVLPVRATRKKVKKARPAAEAKAKKGLNKRATAKKARVAAKATAPKKAPKKATKKAAKK
ncbi:MAG: 30S ribosomal protein S16, partial [Candidatus Eisenbacteria bacterium]